MPSDDVRLYSKQSRSFLKSTGHLSERLPAFKAGQQVLDALTPNDIVLVAGEPGCGKITQLPKVLAQKHAQVLAQKYALPRGNGSLYTSETAGSYSLGTSCC